MKSRKLIVPILFATSLTLAACSGANSEKQVDEAETTVSISDGAKEMKQTLTELKAQLTEKDATKVKESGEKLEESWESFEDEVKDKNRRNI